MRQVLLGGLSGGLVFMSIWLLVWQAYLLMVRLSDWPNSGKFSNSFSLFTLDSKHHVQVWNNKNLLICDEKLIYIEPFELSQNRTTARATYRPTDCLTNRPAERPTGRLNVRLTNWLTNRLTDGLTYKTVSLYSVSLSVSLLVDLLVVQSGNW